MVSITSRGWHLRWMIMCVKVLVTIGATNLAPGNLAFGRVQQRGRLGPTKGHRANSPIYRHHDHTQSWGDIDNYRPTPCSQCKDL